MRSKYSMELVQAPQPCGKVDFLLLTSGEDGKIVIHKRVPVKRIGVNVSDNKSPRFFVKGGRRGDW